MAAPTTRWPPCHSEDCFAVVLLNNIVNWPTATVSKGVVAVLVGEIFNSIYNLSLLTDWSNSGYGDRDFAGKKAYFISNNGDGPYESLRLKEYNSLDGISTDKFIEVAQRHHDALVKWAKDVTETTKL